MSNLLVMLCQMLRQVSINETVVYTKTEHVIINVCAIECHIIFNNWCPVKFNANLRDKLFWKQSLCVCLIRCLHLFLFLRYTPSLLWLRVWSYPRLRGLPRLRDSDFDLNSELREEDVIVEIYTRNMGGSEVEVVKEFK